VKEKKTVVCIAVASIAFLLSWGCSSNREVVRISPPSPPQEQEIQYKKVPTPAEIREAALQKETELLLDETWLLHDCAVDYFEDGERELALFFMEGSSKLLNSASAKIRSNEQVQEASREISRTLDRYKILSLDSVQEKNIPQIEITHDPDSFFDELSDLDLYSVEIPPELEGKVNQDLKNAKFSIPVVINKEVLQFLDYYQSKARNNTQQAMNRSGLYMEEIKKIFKEEGIPEELIYMAHVESLFKHNAYSRARARGMWQFMTGTAKLYGMEVNWWVDERLDPIKSTRVAARYLNYLHDEFEDWCLVMAAYNVGPGRIMRILKKHGDMDYWTMVKRRLIPRETRNHVPATLAAIIIYNNPELYGFTVTPDKPSPTEQFSVEYQIDLGVIAEAIELPLNQLREINPGLQRGVTPFEPKEYTLNIPAGYGEKLSKALDEIPPSKRLRLRHHKVGSGETLSLIASRYGVSIRAISDTNNIRNIHRLKIGQDLIIPLTEPETVSKEEARKVLASSGTHTVRTGDSLYRISRLYGVNLQNLFDWNSLGPKSRIYPGQKILVTPR
jgi:membrane-bound lytic murein transglycosylase D